MRKWLIFFAVLNMLVACGKEEIEKTESSVEESEKAEQSHIEKEIHEEKPKEEEVPTEVEISTEKTEPLYEIDSNTWSVKPIGEANEQVVLLTIDDAPDKNALEMAKILEGLNVKAIFFVNGHFIDTDEEANILKQIYDLGFPIGNHSYSHKNLSELPLEDQYQEIVSLNDRVEEIIGERPIFFRAPFGVNTEDSKKIAADEKMLIMNWSYGYDWESAYQNKEALADIMVNSPYLRNGANLLMHDRTWTKEALADIVKGLQEKGYEVVDPSLIKTPE